MSSTYKTLLQVLFLLLCGDAVYAQHRSEQEAMVVAREFLAERSAYGNIHLSIVPNQNIDYELKRKVKGTERNAGCYVVNDEVNGRFVIVSADERMRSILGYSDNGLFDVESAPLGLLDMLAEYALQYEYLMNEDDIAAYSENTTVTPIPFMIKTQWNQEAPFWGDCPKDINGHQCVTGCVATAMAQVMYYHKWPKKGCGGVVSYDHRSYKNVIAQTYDFDALTINWQNIVESYNGNTTQAQRDEVAKLMHACGVSVYMDYGSSSGASTADIAYALIHHFGYNPNTYYASKEYYTVDEWNELIRSELEAGRPILYGGGSHEFILDGMDNKGLYHFNFGWSGSGDGYYALDAITPDGKNYTSGQVMVVGISSDIIGQHYDVFYADEFQVQEGVAVGAKARILSLPVWCYSSEANSANGPVEFYGVYGVGAFDKDLNFIKSLYSRSVTMSASSGSSLSGTSVVVNYDSSLFTEGSEYLLYPYAKSINSTIPTIMRFKGGEHGWYKATAKGGKITLERGGVISPKTSVPGDSNSDGIVDVADIVNVINHIMLKPTPAFSFDSSDVNQDGEIDVADITSIVNIIMGK